LFIGLTLAAIYFVYLKLRHPNVLFSDKKKVPEFIFDSFASLVQYEHPPNFRNKSSCSAGTLLLFLMILKLKK
jgi:hypothetical protein